MGKLQHGLEGYETYSINKFIGGSNSNPAKEDEHFILYNMIIRSDGKLIPRGKCYEYLLPAPFDNATTKPTDQIVNNSSGPLFGGVTTPYYFWLKNHSVAGRLGFFAVTQSGGVYTFNFIDNTLNTALPSTPVNPSYTYALDGNGAPKFIFSVWNGTGDDAQYQYSGTGVSLSRLITSPPAAQMLTSFYDRSVFAGGGSVNGSIPMRSVIYYSTPSSLTSWPATNYSVPFADRGMVLQDMVVLNGRPLLISSSSFMSLSGTPEGGFIPIEIGRVEDIFLKNTIGVTGTLALVAGLTGVYIPDQRIEDISLPIKGLYRPKTYPYGVNTSLVKTGLASFSTNGYLYGIQNEAIPSTWLKIPTTTGETSRLMVFDSRFECWYYWGFNFNLTGMAPLDAAPANVSAQLNNNFLTGFAFMGASPTNKNAMYHLEVNNTVGDDTVDGVTVNYKTGFVSGPIDFGLPNALKHIGGFHVIGTTQNSVTLTMEIIDEANTSFTSVFSASASALPAFIPVTACRPVRKIRISISGDSTLCLEDIVLYWRPEKLDTNISQYTAPTSLVNLGDMIGGVNFMNNIYITDYTNNRIVRIDDMLGTNWVSYGTVGFGIGQFNLPDGLALDSNNKIYIADSSNNRIERIDDMLGTNWISYGTIGSGVGQFNYPARIALDSNNKIYIADIANNRIVRIDDMLGTNWITYGSFGSGVGQFNSPDGLALDSNNKIYIADSSNNRIVRIDDMLGTNWISYGSLGAGVGQFKYPEGLALDSNNKIYIVDFNNNRIVRVDDMIGTNWISYGSLGSGIGQFSFSEGLALDSNNKIYIADSSNNRIVRIDDMIGTNWISYGTGGSGAGQFFSPWGIKIGKVYV